MPQIFPKFYPQNLVTVAVDFIEQILLYIFGNQFVVDCIFKFIGIGAILGIISIAAMIFTYEERKVCAFMQKRIGPNRVGPYGLLQSMADTLKLMTKEDIIPLGCSRVVWALAPMLLFAPSALIYAFYTFDDGVALADVNLSSSMNESNDTFALRFVCSVHSSFPALKVPSAAFSSPRFMSS